jgi:sigma-B regulation protein RsbU (phosphoserine phosphatase)
MMLTKILAVDDEPDMEELIKQGFRRKIRKNEMDFVFARNGIDALIKLNEHQDIDLILSDINMPEMDGLTLLDKVKDLNKTALKTIMVSAYGDMDNIRTAMNRGAFDFVMKPINFEDLQITIQKTIKQVEHFKKAQVEHNQLEAIKHDLDIAREIQTSILPKTFPAFPNRNEFDLYASMDAAKSVGGDFYDFFLIDENKLGVVIADVSGKGIPAALFMAVSRTMLKTTAMGNISTSECLTKTNNMLCSESVNSMFVTLFYGIINLTTGEMNYSNAGHNPPYILKSDGKVELLEGTGEIVLAALEGINYTQHHTILNPGDAIYMYTDGITEAMNINNELFTDERLKEVLQTVAGNSCKQIIDSVRKEVEEFSKGAEQSDDITAIAVRFFKK